jgi:hypothetical protein
MSLRIESAGALSPVTPAKLDAPVKVAKSPVAVRPDPVSSDTVSISGAARSLADGDSGD